VIDTHPVKLLRNNPKIISRDQDGVVLIDYKLVALDRIALGAIRQGNILFSIDHQINPTDLARYALKK
jgi:hypothetical protein